MVEFATPALPWADLPESLNALGNLVAQLQDLVAAAIAHPVWAVGLVLLAIGLVQMAADLVKRLLKAGLTFLLKLPLTLSQWLWQRFTSPPVPPPTARIQQLISQLETLRQEQDRVLAELKTLLPVSEKLLETRALEGTVPELSGASSGQNAAAESPDPIRG